MNFIISESEIRTPFLHPKSVLGDMLDESSAISRRWKRRGDDVPQVAIVGKPNVGKSSLVNNLLGENRVIVSDIAGTTRDAIDTAIMHNGKEYIFIDTAGLAEKIRSKRN